MSTDNLLKIQPPAKAAVAEMVLSLIAETSGNQLNDIHWNSTLRQELNLTSDDFMRLVKLIEKTYNRQRSIGDESISLEGLLDSEVENQNNLDTDEEESNEIESVGDLIEAVYNEVELG